jgi:ABC-type transport system involved in multi-copper enzyme maturation permease subunit
MQSWALIVDSFRESKNGKIFWVMLAISILVALAMFCFSFEPGGIDILFGTWQIETDLFTIGGKVRPDLISAVAVEWVLDSILGGVGIILALIATAGFFPAMMERGAIEVLLSKPMPRWKLFLGKYAGSMIFIAFHATVFVVLTFLVIGLRWNAWIPGYLWLIPLVILLFSYLYCISALVAILSRSTVAAVLLSLAAWIAFSGVQITEDIFHLYPEWQEYKAAHTVAKAARWIVPKTHDITYLAKKWTGAAVSTELVQGDDISGEDRELLDRAAGVEKVRMAIPAAYTIGSSLLFEAVIVALAMWRFTRQDY